MQGLLESHSHSLSTKKIPAKSYTILKHFVRYGSTKVSSRQTLCLSPLKISNISQRRKFHLQSCKTMQCRGCCKVTVKPAKSCTILKHFVRYGSTKVSSRQTLCLNPLKYPILVKVENFIYSLVKQCNAGVVAKSQLNR